MHATMIGVELMQQKKRIVRMDDGIVINIASVVGLDPWHLLPIYTASKHAVVGFSRAFSVSLGTIFFLCVFEYDLYPRLHFTSSIMFFFFFLFSMNIITIKLV